MENILYGRAQFYDSAMGRMSSPFILWYLKNKFYEKQAVWEPLAMF